MKYANKESIHFDENKLLKECSIISEMQTLHLPKMYIRWVY